MKIFSFLSLLLILSIFSAFYVPNLSIQNTLYYSILDKHNMLKNSKSPKIIFIGGSNLSFGLDSKRISDTYGINVIDMGIHAGIGLKYIANDIKPSLNGGDIVVVSPEYPNFYNVKPSFADGRTELLIIVMDVYPEGRKHIKMEQWLHLSRYIPLYGLKKMREFIQNYYSATFSDVHAKNTGKHKKIGMYHRKAFNEYGDATVHWYLESNTLAKKSRRKKIDANFNILNLFNIFKRKKLDIDKDIIKFLKDYNEFVKSKKAKLYFLYPSYKETLYNRNIKIISRLANELNQINFPMLSTPERSKFSDNLFFNASAYHLTKEGVDLRTSRIIEDLKPIFYKD